MIKIKKIIIVILILSLLIFSVSCKKEKNIESEIKRENNIPKELIAVLENIDKIDSQLLEIKKEMEKTDELEIQKEKELKSVETHKKKIEKMWQGVKKRIESTHTQSNNYKIKAVEEKADIKIIQRFEENLNNTTIFVENKDLLNSFISNNEMYKDGSYFISLYKDYESKVKMLKYDVNRILIYGMKSEWDKAVEGISNLESQYSEMLKTFNKEKKEEEKPSQDDKKKKKALEKLSLSIDSLKQSLQKKDIKLLEIKRTIVITDLERVKE